MRLGECSRRAQTLARLLRASRETTLIAARLLPADMTRDQVREINAMTHIENELIDEACQRVIDYLKALCICLICTTDHGGCRVITVDV